MKEAFTNVYKHNLWGGTESISGPGSSLEQTETIRKEIPLLIERFQIKTFLDAPCGDFNWMKHTTLNVDSYIGVDIVSELIEQNKQKYSDDNRKFICLDIAKDPLPKVDLIFCRDCLVHLSFDDIRLVINNFKRSGSKYLLTTTFTQYNHNFDIQTNGVGWRPLNLEMPPFEFPSPIYIINEKLKAEGYSDKSLALWELDTINF